jgi:undecaprenyl pyrophosphate phosphatase UppP
VESALAIVAAALAVITFFWHDWIELVFKVDPDEGSGALEWGIVVAFAVAAIVAGSLARLEWRRTRQQAASAAS